MKPVNVCYASTAWAQMILSNSEETAHGEWVPARPTGRRTGFFGRLQAAWWVFTGQADALVWMADYYRRHS